MNETSGSGGREKLLIVEHLRKYYPVEKGLVRRVVGQLKALDDVSLHVYEGEALGIVGESGCGKTTLGRCILQVVEPTGGTVLFRHEDTFVELTALSKKEMKPYRRNLQMIFQDPYSSLDPRMTVLDIIGEPLYVNRIAEGQVLENRVKDLMEIVGLKVEYLNRYPHAFSGGQRQRIGIARALATGPKLIICDEAVSALDVSIQAQILNLLRNLQRQMGLTYLFIAHDLSVVEHVSDRVAVMYVGHIVEKAATEDLYIRPLHPYTESLLSAVPTTDPEKKMKRIILPGEVANPVNLPPGCPFHPRCRYAQPLCRAEVPLYRQIREKHYAACHFAGELELRGVG